MNGYECPCCGCLITLASAAMNYRDCWKCEATPAQQRRTKLAKQEQSS